MQIRQATLADMPAILRMGAAFYATTSYAKFADYCPDSVDGLVSGLIENGVFLVADTGSGIVGMVGLYVGPFMFNNAHTAGYEVVWWVNPEARGGMAATRLLKAVEPACKAKGCDAVVMVHMADSPPQAAALYERMGYAHTETSWTKVI